MMAQKRRTHRQFVVQFSSAVDVQEIVVRPVDDRDPRDLGGEFRGLFGRQAVPPVDRIACVSALRRTTDFDICAL